MSHTTKKIAFPILTLVIGAVAAWLLISSRRAPERIEQPTLGPLVEVVTARATSVPVVVTGNGEVVPKVSVDVVPQVSGQIVDVHPSLVAGGFFRTGQVLVTIDPRDYELAVERAQAAVARSSVNLEREQAEAEVARQEWNELHPGEEPTGLVIREPQIRQAEAELAAAEADLAVARLNLERTRISLPFDGVVVSESVDVGQFVGSASRLAQVYGTDVVEVRVPLNSRELAWFEVPSRDRGTGAEAEVSTAFGESRSSWSGRVTRMEAQVDQSSRMVHVVVEIDDPYSTSEGRPALLPGTFVDVRIKGAILDGVIPVPRHAVHEGDRLWIYDEGALGIRDVEILRSDREQSLVGSGIEDGELLIVSSLDAVTDGMTVRNAAEQERARIGVGSPDAPVDGSAS
ncbi:MAG: efflux RND transporter periplasmic adaptor subunit [Thermoanaerobaculales bacterium]|jgi:RND family efflux transporter MFP subunit|nr:efflux RND transporter periplasmic adaptor subunit [Thermoanaerobaculales bacterium]